MNDYELVYLAQEQNEEALEYLYQKYDKLIKGLIFKRFFNLIKLGIDLNDVYNWCLNALNNAIKSYNSDNNAIFSTYATTIVENSIKNYLRNNCKTNEKLNIVIEPFYENQAITYLDFTINYNTDPYYTLSDQEHLSELLIAIKNALSPFEYKVYVLLLNNLKYQDIAKKLNKTPKQIDNAIQRIKNKLKMVLKSMKIA